MSKNEKMVKKSWTCVYCDGINPWDNYYCKSCGSRWIENTEKGKEIEKEEETIIEDNKKEDVVVQRFKEIKEEVETEYHAIDQGRDQISKEKKSFEENILDFFLNILEKIEYFIGFFANSLICLAACFIIFMFIFCLVDDSIFQDTNKKIQVTDLEWKSYIKIENYETLTQNNWILPENSHLLYTKEELYEYENVVSHYENGKAVYNEIPIYKTKYYYEINQSTDSYEYIYETGNNKIPFYSEIDLKDNQKEVERNIIYYVTAIVDNEEVIYYCEKDIFDALEIGQEYEVVISEYSEEHNFGHILKDLYKIEKIGKYTLIEVLDEIFI